MLCKSLLTALFASLALAVPGSANVQIHPDGVSSKCLEVANDALEDGTPVQIYTCNGKPGQNWLINAEKTKIQLGNTNFCLDAGQHPDEEVRTRIWTCNDNIAAQNWFYNEKEMIVLKGKGLCLQLIGGILTDGTPVQTVDCDKKDPNEIWTTSPYQL